jgi:hypothetical protein
VSIRTLKGTFLLRDDRTQSITKGSGAQASLGKRDDAEIRIKPFTASLAEVDRFPRRHRVHELFFSKDSRQRDIPVSCN